MSGPYQIEFSSLAGDAYKLPEDVSTIIAYARQKVINRIALAPNDPDRHIPNFCQTIRGAPTLLDHYDVYAAEHLIYGFDKSEKETNAQSKEEEASRPKEKMTQADIRQIFLIATIVHEQLLAWMNYYKAHNYTHACLVSKFMAVEKPGQLPMKKTPAHDPASYRNRLDVCEGPYLVDLIKAVVGAALKPGEDIGKTWAALNQMAIFEDNWWLKTPLPKRPILPISTPQLRAARA